VGLSLFVTCLLAPAAQATTYKIDQDHTTVSFKIRHLFSYVQGTFNDFEGQFTYDAGAPKAWTVQAVVQAESIDTGVAKRDQHLRSGDFFDAAQYPTLEFRSTEITAATPSSATLRGQLTIHGVERPVAFDLAIHGEGKDPWGNQRSGFTATTTINRTEFGLKWNEALETGQLLVGEEVQITLEVEGVAVE